MQRKLLPFLYVLMAVPFLSPNEVFGAETWKLIYRCPSSPETITQELPTREACERATTNVEAVPCTIVERCAREGDGDPGTIRLDRSGYSPEEFEGQVMVTAGRTGGTGDVRVLYYVEKVTCNGECNFYTQSGVLHWPSGDTNDHIFSIQLTDDDKMDGNDIGTIILKDEAGEEIVSATLTVVDDESENEADCVDAGYTCTESNECDKQSSGHTCSGGKVCCESKLPLPKLGEPEKDVDDKEGLVPCGDNIKIEHGTNAAGKEVFRYTGECGVCHFQRLIKRVLDFLILLAVAFCALLFVNAGMLYTMASANAANVGKAHKLFTNTLIGLVLILAAYLLIDVAMKSFVGGEFGTWNELLCEGFTPWYEVEKMSTIILESEELVLPELEKAKCIGDLTGIGCAKTCGTGQTPMPNTDCEKFPDKPNCCVDSTGQSYKYGNSCAFKESGHGSKGTCSTANVCSGKYSERNDEACGSNLVCCEGTLPLGKGLCSVEYLSKYWPEEKVKVASCVCNGESTGDAGVGSGADICKPNGPSASWGLFQINLTNETINGLNCKSAISSPGNVGYTGKKHNELCSVKDDEASRDLWNKCVDAAKNPEINIAKAIDMQTRYGWGRWGAYKKNNCINAK